MIGMPIALLIAFVLLALLLLVGIRGVSAARERSSRSDVPFSEDGSELSLCPPEFVSRIFSSDDSEFVSATRSPQLRQLFRRERKAVALLWVQQTSAAVQRIMDEHRQLARVSRNLEFVTEAKLLLLYAELMLICGALFAAIQSAGPLSLRRLAIYADAHSQRLAQVQQSFKAASTPRELHGAGAA
jgi:hypothetical protein